ncbi:MAG: hypothetical protein QM621_11160 [Aeromicrobium sp.]|uniref:DUF6777 domain-containing protein n=1 Tax=Aeromicrobium sp. TaxID=1871063 RepID=UPI0039E64A66
MVLKAADDPGSAPFTDSVASGVALSADALARIDTDMAGHVDGATPGLYGGTNGTTVADPTALVDLLAADPARSEAWAGTLTLDAADVAAAIAELTPVVLTRDTAVVDHRYEDGEAVPYPAVLQAGTAVLVDDHGTPVVRCASGSPLTMPEDDLNLSDTSGDAWDGYEPEAVIGVAPAAEPVTEFTLIDADTGEDLVVSLTGPTEEWVYPFDAASELEDGWTIRPGSESGGDTGQWRATAPGVYKSYVSATTAMCWEDPNISGELLCQVGDIAERELWRYTVSGPLPTAPGTDPLDPIFYELETGVRCTPSSMGGRGVGRSDGFMDWAMCWADGGDFGGNLYQSGEPVEKTDDGWFVHTASGDEAPLERVRVAKVWYPASPTA